MSDENEAQDPEAAEAVNAAEAIVGGRKRGRPKKGVQSSLQDVRIEDPELEVQLEAIANTRVQAQTFREASKKAKARMKEEHADAINADRDGMHSGWVICGAFRFKARTAYREAKEVKIKQSEGVTWDDFEVERLESPASA